MARCNKTRGLLVFRPCQMPSLGVCITCGCQVCAEHAMISNKQIFCLACFVDNRSGQVSVAEEDWNKGETENFGVWMEKARTQVHARFNPIPLRELYNFNSFDFQAFEKEYLSYYDIGESKTNVYDS